jgi:endonuclease YncB( thermonuclease family)
MEATMAMVPFALLAAALLMLLLSTRQFPLSTRAMIWLVGAAFLAGAAWLALERPGGYGLLERIKEALTDGSTTVAVTQVNWPRVGQAVPAMFDVFWFMAAILALLAVLAFTPGEALEKCIRPLKVGLIGAVVGAFLALFMIATGFAGYVKDRMYVATLAEQDVHDGDTIRIDDVSLRLADIDAPEIRQHCRLMGRASNCGEVARRFLYRLTQSDQVICGKPSSKNGDRLKETFGRPLVDCTVSGKSLSAAMLEAGQAVKYAGRPGPVDGKSFRLGCTLAPSEWRNNAQKRKAFEMAVSAGSPLPKDASYIGDCQT